MNIIFLCFFLQVVLSVFIAVAAAGIAPIAYTSSAIIHEPAIAKVGDIVESIPSAVSHQSSTVVHGKANLITPVVAPAVRTYAAPLIKSYGLAAPAYTAYVGPYY